MSDIVIDPKKIYVLTEDVTNPKPDKRASREWELFPVWERGTRFSVKFYDDREAQINKAEPAIVLTRFSRSGIGSAIIYGHVPKKVGPFTQPSARRIKALLSHAAVRNPITATEVLFLEGNMGDAAAAVLDLLVEAGKVTPDEVRIALTAYLKGESDG